MKKFEEIIVPADGNPRWYGGAYALAFVYSNTGNYLVKGYHDEVKAYVRENFKKYFVNYSLWWQGHHREIWKFWKESVGVFSPSGVFKHKKWEIRRYMMGGVTDGPIVRFKRLPKCWVKELDVL